MDAVKSFNDELSSIYETKPPVSRAKMTTLTKKAIKGIKFYKHIVQSMEKFIQKCRPEYKVPGLYVIDSVVRQSRHQFGQEKDVFMPRLCKNILTTFKHLYKCPPEEKQRIIRVLNLWQKNSVFPPDIVQQLLVMGGAPIPEASTSGAAPATEPPAEPSAPVELATALSQATAAVAGQNQPDASSLTNMLAHLLVNPDASQIQQLTGLLSNSQQAQLQALVHQVKGQQPEASKPAEPPTQPEESAVFQPLQHNSQPPFLQSQCNIGACNQELSWHSSTSTMRSHRAKHPFIWLDENGGNESKPLKQAKLKLPVCTSSRVCTVERKMQLRNKIANMIIKDMRPISVVEDDGFREVMKDVEPNYSLPSRKLMTQVLKTKYSEAKKKLRRVLGDFLSRGSKLALTTDIWTSTTGAFLSLTTHFIDPGWHTRCYILGTTPLDERHTGKNITNWILDLVDEYEIPHSAVVAIVHDNGSNVVAAANELKTAKSWESVRCVGHTLQLVVNDALKIDQVSDAVKSSKSLAAFFKQSELASTTLKKMQEKMGIVQHRLIQCVPTRWNSVFHMIKRLAEQRWVLSATLSEPALGGARCEKKEPRKLDLHHDQWLLLDRLGDILEPFEAATTFLSREKYPTISLCPVLIAGLKKFLESSSEDSDSNGEEAATDSQSKRASIYQKFKDTLLSGLESRWSFDRDDVATLGAALDPRYSKLKFLPPPERAATQATIAEICGEVTQQHRSAEQTISHQRSDDASVLQCILDMGCGDGSSNSEDEENEEVARYFSLKSQPKSTNPLRWWRDNEQSFPTVAKAARSYLCIPATSTASERVFSTAGLTVTILRSSLRPKNVEMLVFLHENSEFL